MNSRLVLPPVHYFRTRIDSKCFDGVGIFVFGSLRLRCSLFFSTYSLRCRPCHNYEHPSMHSVIAGTPPELSEQVAKLDTIVFTTSVARSAEKHL